MDIQEEELDKMFSSNLYEKNALIRTINIHLDIEYWVNELIEGLVENPDKLKPMGLDYFRKVHLVTALGLDEGFSKPLLYIGNIRNKFAHNLNYSITKDVANNFYKQFTERDKKVIHTSFKDSKEGVNHEVLKDYETFKDMTIENQFIFLSLAVRNMAKASVYRLRNGKSIKV